MTDVHPRSMFLLVLALVLSALRPADADNGVRKPVAPAPQKVVITKKTTAQWAKDRDNFKIYLGLVHGAGLDDWLGGKTHYTWLLPSDSTFAQLPSGVLDELRKPANHDLTAQLLKFQIVPGDQRAFDLVKVKRITTAQGEELSVTAEAGAVQQFGPARVVGGQVPLRNGTVYEIDRVLIPASAAKILKRKGYNIAASEAPSAK